jgi:hypothetical protein
MLSEPQGLVQPEELDKFKNSSHTMDEIRIHCNLNVFLISYELFMLLLFNSIVTGAVLIFVIVSQRCKTAKGDSNSLNR